MYILYNIHIILDKQSIETNRFILEDTCGDGWSSVYFYNYDFYGSFIKKTTTCENKIVVHEYCFDPSVAIVGDHMGATVFGLHTTTSFLFEIHWKAIITTPSAINKEEEVEMVYTGAYKTYMMFEFSRHNNKCKTPYVSLLYSKNLVSNDDAIEKY